MSKAGAMLLNQLSPHREQIDSYEQVQCCAWEVLYVTAQCFMHAYINSYAHATRNWSFNQAISTKQ